MAAIQPCPFCGAPARVKRPRDIGDTISVQCIRCFAQCAPVELDWSIDGAGNLPARKEAAVELALRRWNRRADVTPGHK